MVGTIINAAAILTGGVAGLTVKKQIPVVHQTALKILLGVFTVYVGLSATWQGLNGGFLHVPQQPTALPLPLMPRKPTGKLLRPPKYLNRLGPDPKQKNFPDAPPRH